MTYSSNCQLPEVSKMISFKISASYKCFTNFVNKMKPISMHMAHLREAQWHIGMSSVSGSGDPSSSLGWGAFISLTHYTHLWVFFYLNEICHLPTCFPSRGILISGATFRGLDHITVASCLTSF